MMVNVRKRIQAQGLYLNRVIDYLFSETDFQVIQAGNDIRNPNSGKVMKHCVRKYKGTYIGERLIKEASPLTFVAYDLKRWEKQNNDIYTND